MIIPGEPQYLTPSSGQGQSDSAIEPNALMLSPSNAWRILERRTRFNIGRSTFYRWIQTGKIFSLKLGGKIYIPWAELEHVVQACRAGERL